MRKGWEVKKLGEVCEYKSGTTISNKLEKVEGEILYIKVGDMNLEGNEEFITCSSRYVNISDINSNQIIPQGSIIFPKRGGAIATNKKRRIVSPTIVDLNTMALIPNKIINSNYLYYWFKQIDLASLSNGTSIPQINNYSFDNVYINLPNSQIEQERIVAILDEAFGAIDKAKENLERNMRNAKKLFESELNSIFEKKGDGWVEKKLGEVCDVKDGTHDSPRYIEEGIPFVTQKNIREDGLTIENTKFITQEDHDKFYKRSNVKFGDILISMIGANRGMACIVNERRIFSIKNVCLVKENKNIVQKYLLYFLKSKQAINFVKTSSKGGAQEFIGLTELRIFPIPLPSIKEQQKIVEQLDRLSVETKKLEEGYGKKLESLEELKKSMLERAFRGELNKGE